MKIKHLFIALVFYTIFVVAAVLFLCSIPAYGQDTNSFTVSWKPYDLEQINNVGVDRFHLWYVSGSDTLVLSDSIAVQYTHFYTGNLPKQTEYTFGLFVSKYSYKVGRRIYSDIAWRTYIDSLDTTIPADEDTTKPSMPVFDDIIKHGTNEYIHLTAYEINEMAKAGSSWNTYDCGFNPDVDGGSMMMMGEMYPNRNMRIIGKFDIIIDSVKVHWRKPISGYQTINGDTLKIYTLNQNVSFNYLEAWGTL